VALPALYKSHHTGPHLRNPVCGLILQPSDICRALPAEFSAFKSWVDTFQPARYCSKHARGLMHSCAELVALYQHGNHGII
jgi:hypothetical protein